MSVVERVLDKRRPELRVLERDTSKLESVKSPFPRLAYDDAVTQLKGKGLPIEWGGDFGPRKCDASTIPRGSFASSRQMPRTNCERPWP